MVPFRDLIDIFRRAYTPFLHNLYLLTRKQVKWVEVGINRTNYVTDCEEGKLTSTLVVLKHRLLQPTQIYLITIFASVFSKTDLQTVDKHSKCTGWSIVFYSSNSRGSVVKSAEKHWSIKRVWPRSNTMQSIAGMLIWNCTFSNTLNQYLLKCWLCPTGMEACKHAYIVPVARAIEQFQC